MKLKGEIFFASGLTIEDLGYMHVYPYDRWADRELPAYADGEIIPKFEVTIKSGTTTAPALLTEADLITLMDRHGIGTDATHAEHIEKIKTRNYVVMTNDNRFKPTFMGMGLVDGYNRMGQEVLSRPNLRADLERELQEICAGECCALVESHAYKSLPLGRRTKAQVLANQLQIYRGIFTIAEQGINQLAVSLHQFINHMPDGN